MNRDLAMEWVRQRVPAAADAHIAAAVAVSAGKAADRAGLRAVPLDLMVDPALPATASGWLRPPAVVHETSR